MLISHEGQILQTLCVSLKLLFHRTKLLGGEVGLKVEGTNSGGGLVSPSIIVGGVGGGALQLFLSLLYFINILPVVIMNVFYVS